MSIATDVTNVLSALVPVVDVLDPAIGNALALAAKLLSGVAAAEPTAVSLYNSLTSATPPTDAQLEAYAANYETAYQKLNTDLGT